jgi:hypothetical protein
VRLHDEPQANPMPIVAVSGDRKRGKSANPDYVKLTSYIRRETHRAVKRRLLDEGREISELIEELFGQWLAGQTPSASVQTPPSH